MRIAEINIPKGCEKILIDQEETGIVITYDSNINSRDFFCKETQEKETLPSIGDFAIFWDDNFRRYARVACLEKEDNRAYRATDGFGYQNAIKFRNYEQYLLVRGIHE